MRFTQKLLWARKSYCAARHPDKVVDFVCMPYKYLIDPAIPFDESNKANHDLDMNPDWPYNYVNAIMECPQDKIILIPSDSFVLYLLSVVNIPYYLCYPSWFSKRIYRKRFIKRGNSQEFLSIFIGKWKYFMRSFRNDTYGKHIKLRPHQYLSDVIDIQSLLDH